MKKRYIPVTLIVVLFFAVGTLLYFLDQNKENSSELTLYGNVDIREADLGFRVLGRLEEMRVDEGDVVKKGDLLALLDKQPFLEELERAKAKEEAVRVSLENSKLIVERREDLVKTRAVSEEEYDDAVARQHELEAELEAAKKDVEIAKTRYEDTEVIAPSDGTILTRVREPGAVVVIGDPVYTLSLPSPVWVRAYVSEKNLGRIYPGMPAEVITDTKGAPAYQGHIGFISPVAEFTPKTVETLELRTDLVYRLRIVVDNPDRGLRQGMPVTVKLKGESH